MPHGVPKPDLKTIGDLEFHLRQIWQKAHLAWDTKVTYYNGTFQVWPDSIPAGSRPSYHPGKAAAKVDGAVNSMLAYEPKVHVFGEGEGVRAETRAGKLEPWLTAMFANANKREVVPIWRTAKQNLMLPGWTVIEGPWATETKPPEPPERERGEDDEEWEVRQGRYEYEREVWNPIRFTVPPPRTVLVDPMERKLTCAIKRGTWYGKDIGNMLANKKAKRYADVEVGDYQDGKQPFALVQCTEYWTPEWHALIRSGTGSESDPGQLLYVEENAWGFVPFVHTFSGWGHDYGQVGTGGLTLGGQEDLSLRVETMSRGILDGELESLKLYAQAMAARHNSAIEAGFQKMGTTKEAQEIVPQLEADLVEKVEEKDIFWLKTPQLPGWQFQVSAEYDKDIEEGTFPGVVVGERAEGVSTVGQHALMRKDAGSRFTIVTEQLSFMATILAENTLRLVEVIGEEITIDSKTIGPKDIKGNYQVKVTFESVDPILRNQERLMAREDVIAGLMSRETYHSITGQEDPVTEERKIMEDKVMQSPQVQALVAQVVSMGLGIQGLQQQIAALQAQMNPPTPTGVGAQGLVGPNGQPIRTPPAMVPEGSPQEAASVSQGIEQLMQP